MHPLSGLKCYHHFLVNSGEPGIISVKEHSDDDFQKFVLLKSDDIKDRFLKGEIPELPPV